MEKKDLDWGNIGFTYMPTDMRYVADYKDGAWGEGALTADSNVVINECAGILQYCQECFEGLKAYTTEDGSIVTFRPDLNAERMMDSAARCCFLTGKICSLFTMPSIRENTCTKFYRVLQWFDGNC